MTGDGILQLAVLSAGLMLSCASCAADLRKVTLRPTYTLDLESGTAGGLGPSQDLFWQAKTGTERCLGPSLQSTALLAPLPERDFAAADAARLASLTYSARCFAHTNSGGELRKGFSFAVRTVEGNFAKVRVAGISSRNDLDLEWQVFPPAVAQGAASSNPSLTIPQLIDQARRLLRQQRRDDAVPPLQEAVVLAGRLPAGASRAEALSQAGQLLWSAGRPNLAESALLAAAQQMENLPASAVANETRSMTFRMLGVVYRDQQKFTESIPWFERAVKTDEARPESTPQLAGQKYFTMSSNLRSLSEAQCRAGNTPAAEATDQRRLEACGRSPNPWTVGSCRDGKRPCKDGWMPDGAPVRYDRKQ